MENLNGDIRTIPCGHKFHTACYGEWESKSHGNTTTCPCCRAEHTVPEYSQHRPRHRGRSMPRTRVHRRPEARNHYQDNNFNTGIPFIEEMFRNMHAGIGLEEVIRMRMERNRVPVVRDMTPKEAFITAILLALLLAIVYCITTVHSTCICNVRWKPGETTRTEQFFFGGESTYNRPELCTWVC